MMPDKALHSLLLDRIYHEDDLFIQRANNFVTINAFFAAVFALSVTGGQTEYFAYIIAGFGLLLGLFQVALGARLVATSNFWRQYLWLVEKQIGINFDRAQFEFYEKGVAETPAGIIVLADANKKPMYQTFPWRLSLMPSVNILVGLVIPWAVTIILAVIARRTAIQRAFQVASSCGVGCVYCSIFIQPTLGGSNTAQRAGGDLSGNTEKVIAYRVSLYIPKRCIREYRNFAQEHVCKVYIRHLLKP